MDQNDFWIDEASNNFKITPDLHNYILLEANDVTINFVTHDFMYHLLGLITANGEIRARIYGCNIAFELQFSWAGAKQGRYVPSFHTVATRVTCSDRIEIYTQGDLMMSIIDIIQGLFKGIVHDVIVSQINEALMHEIPTAINALIEEQNGITMLYNNMDLDWSLSGPPIFSAENGVEFGIKGLFVPEGQEEVIPPVTPPPMPYKDASIPSQF